MDIDLIAFLPKDEIHTWAETALYKVSALFLAATAFTAW